MRYRRMLSDCTSIHQATSISLSPAANMTKRDDDRGVRQAPASGNWIETECWRRLCIVSGIVESENFISLLGSEWQCCCSRGKSLTLTLRILEDQLTTPYPRPCRWILSPRKFSRTLHSANSLLRAITWRPKIGYFPWLQRPWGCRCCSE